MMTFYEFTVKRNDGSDFALSAMKGKIVLVVNSAFHDSFADQYSDLERLYRQYHEKDFEILDFPCNQFHGMAFEDDREIDSMVKEAYHTSFTRFAKCDVRGENALPLFRYLSQNKPFKGLDPTHPMSKVINSFNIKEGYLTGIQKDVRWNFTKFLIDRKGKTVRRFEPVDGMDCVIKAVSRLVDTQPMIKESNLNGVYLEVQ